MSQNKMNDYVAEYRGGVKWHIAYLEKRFVRQPFAGYVAEEGSGTRLVGIGKDSEEGVYWLRLYDGEILSFRYFEDAIDKANSDIAALPEKDRRRFPIHELTGRSGIYLLGEAEGTVYAANVYWTKQRAGAIDATVFQLGDRSLRIIDGGVSDRYLSIGECLNDLVAAFTPFENGAIQLVADCSRPIDSFESYQEALENGRLSEGPILLSDLEKGSEHCREELASPNETIVNDLDAVIDEARSRMTEKGGRIPSVKDEKSEERMKIAKPERSRDLER